MAEILTELQVAEAKVKNIRVPLDSAKYVYANYELQIFGQHNISAETYQKSLAYYLENSRAMGRINEAVLDKLTQLKDSKEEELKNFEPEPLKKPDSDTLTKTTRPYLPLDSTKRLRGRKRLPVNPLQRKTNSVDSL